MEIAGQFDGHALLLDVTDASSIAAAAAAVSELDVLVAPGGLAVLVRSSHHFDVTA